MLSTRSKILVMIAVAVGLAYLFDWMRNHGSWGYEPVQDWYVQWILVVVCVLIAATSVMLDLRRER